MARSRLPPLVCTLIPVLCAGISVAQSPPISLNLETTYAPVRQAMLAGDADIVCMGDSLTFRADSYLPVLRSRLQSRYGNGGAGYRSAIPGELFAYPNTSFNEWWFGTLGPGSPPYMSLDGLWSFAFSPSIARAVSIWPSFRLHVLATPHGGLWTARDDSGQFSVTIDAYAPVPAFRAFDISNPFNTRIELRRAPLPLTTEEVPFELRQPGTTGTITILGGIVDATSPGVRVHRVANGGWGVNNFLMRDFTLDAQLQNINPDLYIILLGQNDTTVPITLWRDRYNQLLDRLIAATPSARFILVSSYDSGYPNLDQMAGVVAEIAQQRGLGFINLFEVGGPFQRFVDEGLLADPVHFNQAGGRLVGNLLFDALETAGASLTAACNDIDFNNNNVFPEDQDVIDFFAVLSGGDCPTAVGSLPGCDSVDFNRNGVYPEDQDIIDFLNVLAGVPC